MHAIEFTFFVQVLNKRKKSKQSARKEAFNRTRDIHTIQDLYPPQQILLGFIRDECL